jgi:hypothetical protein
MRSFERTASSSSSNTAGVALGLASRTSSQNGSSSSLVIPEALSTDLMNDTEIPLIRSPRYRNSEGGEEGKDDDEEAMTGWARAKVEEWNGLLGIFDALRTDAAALSSHQVGGSGWLFSHNKKISSTNQTSLNEY